MYCITHTPTREVIALTTTWQDAATTLRRHADTHDDHTYNAVTADPSVILHLGSMGDGAYIITRDEGDLRLCDTCGHNIGIITSQSGNHPHGTGSWSIACCADCAAEWEANYPCEPTDYTAADIHHIVTTTTHAACPDCAESLSTDCPDCGGYGITTTCSICHHHVTEWEESYDGGKWCNTCNGIA